AYAIRLYAVKDYGLVIHEFDPWFNFRATQYLADNGWTEFFHWYDHKSWYPLGRPVGTTIFPGMQITSVCIWKILPTFGIDMSLNDVCVMTPAWFGVVATTFLALLSAECAGTYLCLKASFALIILVRPGAFSRERSWAAGTAAALVMSVIPAHIMRSVAGGYDNESMAVSALCATFYFWCRSLRNDASWIWGIATGFAYIYMFNLNPPFTLIQFARSGIYESILFSWRQVAVWGGYIFVVNMIGVHAGVLVLLGQYSSSLHKAYSLWFIIGTFGATRVPVVGMAPFKSLEQLGPFGVFLGIQLLEICEQQRKKKKLSMMEVQVLRMKVFGVAGAALAVLVAILLPTGYFGPLSSRVRGLFVKHTRTGNPLVDSVAEHQPASPQAYWQYLHYSVYCAPTDIIISAITPGARRVSPSPNSAHLVFFKRRRGTLYNVNVRGGTKRLQRPGRFGVASLNPNPSLQVPGKNGEDGEEMTQKDAEPTKKEPNGNGGKKSKKTSHSLLRQIEQGVEWLQTTRKSSMEFAFQVYTQTLRIGRLTSEGNAFYGYSHQMAHQMSNPSIMYKARLQNGKEIIIDDYREAYWWVRDKTPDDARIMAWWDYGYQIAGIGNRTTIADGNTWNHEHIATLGKCLASEENAAHAIVKHLADFVLVWVGGGGDDLAKSPHMARIGNSVYHDICPGDPTCRQFGFYDRHGTPTPMMEKSLLYTPHHNPFFPPKQEKLNPCSFPQVYTSKYNKVRIYKVRGVSKKSRKWVANPKNRICDAPGSWYCSGQYPPALKELIASRTNFAQLEDFNTKRNDKD
ncbi:Oligosaccharyl transferase STT3 subunit-domain-containing protein, partial [Baffinella frigidus]